jgi:ribosomal protein L13
MEEKDPERILWKAVYGMLPKNRVGKKGGANVTVAGGEN